MGGCPGAPVSAQTSAATSAVGEGKGRYQMLYLGEHCTSEVQHGE